MSGKKKGIVSHSMLSDEMAANLLLNSAGAETPLFGCLTDEEIGAFLDHSLAEEESERVEDHVSRCETCFEVYSAALKSELAMSATEKVQPAVWVRRSLVLAAVIAFFALVLNQQVRQTPPSLAEKRALPLQELSVSELAQHVTSPAPHFTFESASPQQVAFRIGVQTADLMICVRSGRAELMRESGNSLLVLIRRIEPSEAFSGRLLNLIKGGPMRSEDLAVFVREHETTIQRHNITYPYDLGLWAEFSRISALSRSASGLRREDTLYFLAQEQFRSLPVAVRAQLSEIERRLANPPESGMDFDLMADRFNDLIQLGSR